MFMLELSTAVIAYSIYIDGVGNQYIQLAEIDVFGDDPLAIV